jgi:hypothetical protein
MILELLQHHQGIIHNIIDHLITITCRPFTLLCACKELQAAVLEHPRAQHAAKYRQVCGDISALNILYNGEYNFIEFNNDVHLYVNYEHRFIVKNKCINTIINHKSIDGVKIYTEKRYNSIQVPIKYCALILDWVHKYPNIRIVSNNDNKQVLLFDIM